jgi:hypothetical protein
MKMRSKLFTIDVMLMVIGCIKSPLYSSGNFPDFLTQEISQKGDHRQ